MIKIISETNTTGFWKQKNNKINERLLHLRKINKLNKLQLDWPGYKKKKAQITSIKNGIRNITAHTRETEKIIRDCYNF